MDLMRNLALIDGQWVGADSGETLEVTDPATGRVIGAVPRMGKAETLRAIDAADAAQRRWRDLTANARAAVLRRWHELVLSSEEALARLLTLEQGKPLEEARGEIRYAASFISWFAEEGRRVYGDVVPANEAGKRIFVFKEPVGVVGAITPWNFPAAMVTRKLAPALAAGCTVVLKPAAQTPFTALALADLAVQAGVSAGVLNVVTGAATAVGEALTESSKVRKLTFTGSTPVGKKLMAQCAPTLKRLSLELGGNAPFIVFDDADLDAAIEGVMVSKFRNTGQTCVCANRILVQGAIHDAFVERLRERVAALRIGPGLDGPTDQGPLIDDNGLRKVEEHVADALAKGAHLVAGGRRHALGGAFFEPTILCGVTPDMLVAQEETFGPLAPIFRFETEQEALALANDTSLGLASYFYTRDIARLFRVARELECGMVGANTGMISTEVAPFGGIKESGMGREGSKYGIEDYLEVKYLCVSA